MPLTIVAALLLTAQRPVPRPSKTFAEQVEVREVELVVDLAGSLSRLKKETLGPDDLSVIEDGQERPVTRVGPIAEERLRNLFRDEAVAQPDWTVVVWIDRVLAGPDTAFYAALSLSQRAEPLTALGPVEVIVADPSPRLALAATREPKRVEQALTDLVAQAGHDRDRPAGRPGLRPNARSRLEETALRRQCERLAAGMAAPRPGGPRLLLLVADGFALTPAELNLLESDSPETAETGRAAALQQTARLLAAYGWTTVLLPLHGESPGRLHQEGSALDRLRIADQGGGKYGNSVPPVIPPRPPKSNPLQWEGIAEMQVQPDLAPLRTLVQETAGAIAGFDEQLDAALEAIAGRWHLWSQVPDPRDGRLHSVQVRLRNGQTLRARRWLRSATPEALAAARLRRLLGGEAPPGADLPLEIRAVRAERGAPPELRLTLSSFAEPSPVPPAPVRISLAFAGPGESILVRHEEVPGIADPAKGWTRAVPLPADVGDIGQVAVVVDDLGRERWAGALVRLPAGVAR